MAERAATITDIRSGIVKVEWSGLLNTDTGSLVDRVEYADRSVQVTGTFGVGGNCRIEGSNDGANWATLTDPQGNALDITAAKIEAISENPLYVRPNITAGDGTTNLAVTIVGRRVI